MEPGPERMRGALALAAVAGIWIVVWIAVFTWMLPDPNLTLATVAILAAIAAGWAFPGPWFGLVAGFMLIGAGIGMTREFSMWPLIVCLLVAAVLFARWWRRTGPRLRLYRAGTCVAGEVVAVDGDVDPGTLSSETSHVTMRHEVRYRAAHGIEHIVRGRSTFEVGHQPRVGGVVDVYYLPDDPRTAVPVFRPRSAAR